MVIINPPLGSKWNKIALLDAINRAGNLRHRVLWVKENGQEKDKI